MKRMKQILLLLITSVIFISCESNRNSLIGKCDGDEIRLSKNKVIFDSNKNTIKITTKGKWWWISDIFFNDKHIDIYKEATQTGDNFLIINDDFTIERKSKTEIFIEMSKNNTDKERKLGIGVQAGDCFDAITVIQKAKN